MKLLLENWRKFLKESEEEPEEETPEPEANILDLSKELDSGFCEYIPSSINMHNMIQAI